MIKMILKHFRIDIKDNILSLMKAFTNYNHYLIPKIFIMIY